MIRARCARLPLLHSALIPQEGRHAYPRICRSTSDIAREDPSPTSLSRACVAYVRAASYSSKSSSGSKPVTPRTSASVWGATRADSLVPGRVESRDVGRFDKREMVERTEALEAGRNNDALEGGREVAADEGARRLAADDGRGIPSLMFDDLRISEFLKS
jgi:hypothetical protein